MARKLFFLFLFSVFSMSSLFSMEEEMLRRIRLHMIIGDYLSAKKEAKEAIEKFPSSPKLEQAYIKALAKRGDEEEFISLLKKFVKKHEISTIDRSLFEEVAWQVLDKGIHASQQHVRFTALIGAYFTRDVRAVKYLLKMMDDSNAIVRSLAVKLACDYQDAPIKEKIKQLLEKEKLWLVRLEILRAMGIMKIKDKKDVLEKLLLSDRTSLEEKAYAIEALVNIYEDVEEKELKTLFESNRYALRCLAIEIALHLEKENAKKYVLSLAKDKHVEVRLATLRCFNSYLYSLCSQEEIEEYIKPLLEDIHPLVAITAAWVYFPFNEKLSLEKLKKWLKDPSSEYRRFAAAALAHSGQKAVSQMISLIDTTDDAYVKANLAMGLIGQKAYSKKACDEIYLFLEKENKTLLMEEEGKMPFLVLGPSRVRHLDHIPNYPEAVDANCRLKLISLLAMRKDDRATELIKSFLKSRRWGISAFAASLLMQEGNQEAMEKIKQLLEDDDINVKIQAALVLSLFGRDTSAMPVLQKTYFQAEHERKMHILQAMGFVAEEDDFKFFIDVLDEPFQLLRVIDASSFIQSLHR